MKFLLVIIIFSFTFIGCTTSNSIISSQNDVPGWTDQFNATAKDKKATILFRDSEKLDANEVHANLDSISFFQTKNQTRGVVHINSIKKITFTNPTRGLFEGAGIGLLGGAATGLLTAYISMPAHPIDLQALGYIVVPIIFGGIGSIIGGTIGVISEHKYEYEFTNSLEQN